MPFSLYLLGLAVFAQGTSEFMLSGLGPAIAADLAVSLPAAGALTSAFALGMIVGAPLAAILSLRWSRRRALLLFLLCFLFAHVVGALTTGYWLLLAMRILGALANAGFLAVALITATDLVAPDAKGRATATLLGGVTIACIAGVPAGALLGQLWGWRSAFWAVAIISVPAVVGILHAVPTGAVETRRPSARRELRALRRPRLAVTLLLAALVNGATFCTFTYLAPVITEIAGLGAAWVPAMLALFGFGSFIGVASAGHIADTRPIPLLGWGGLALCVGWVGFAVTAGHPVAATVLVLITATLSFAVGSTLISQMLYAATEAPNLAGALATAAFNVGAALGPWLGGLAIGAGFGYRSPLWISAALVASALVVGGTAWATGRRDAVPPPDGEMSPSMR
ncbi:Cmx/CmrA family chloramphenicol efflux MFS transporter [Actinoalloteichus hymeniacidonis]|uniref:Arabinose efflux permease family protein n=1 Tax=Actinoalloteichus hymeniacidonis TaxID=340345 RepID=A0AAC9HPZ4_9PSEU|nr:Cmx/CmrA family chloramphenicol efflux MFS transporter [Actinoalloteichus hymeniacidonis]AOS63492.1 arabinose efflux permease family protein [Actinoalloteichus hymeniacidonis]MBB5908464.1 DHA1 family chloramphenicol resistance protein-like MFS transporter [Actinoalloteichus hymeniacidonis]